MIEGEPTLEAPKFRAGFVNWLIGSLAEKLPDMNQPERAHSLGVIINTVATLGVTRRDRDIEITLAELNEPSIDTIRELVTTVDWAATFKGGGMRRYCSDIEAALITEVNPLGNSEAI